MKIKIIILLLGTTILLVGSDSASVLDDKVEEAAFQVSQQHEEIEDLRQEILRLKKIRYQEAIEKAKEENPIPNFEEEPVASNPIISLSAEEKKILSQLVEAEAKGEPFEGKIGVAIVVLNRVLHEEFPNDVKSVIYQKRQFTPVANGSINNKPSEESRQAVEDAIQRINAGNTSGSLYFYNPKLCSSPWHESLTTVKKVGNHIFKK